MLVEEIVKHVLASFGIKFDKTRKLEKLESFILKDKVILSENENDLGINLYGIETNVENSLLRVAGVSFTEDDVYVLVISFDQFPPYIVYHSENLYEVFLYNDGKFFDTNLCLKAKLLLGVEQLFDLPLIWDKMKNGEEFCDIIIGFLNFRG